jgi:Tol biopolymer transport system component
MRRESQVISPLLQAFGRIYILACISLFSCNFPGRLLRLFQTPTYTPTATNTATPTSTSTLTPLSIFTITSTLSATPSLTPSISSSPTSGPTPTLPTLTPAPNQITNGDEIWDLKSVDYPAYITVFGRLFSPPTRRDPFPAYVFMRMNFSCTTGDSLIKLYTGQDMGLTFTHKQTGYTDLSIEDLQGHKYLVTLLGTCWLAAPIPSTLANEGYFILNFKNMPTFKFAVQQTVDEINQRICFISDQRGTPEVFTAKPDGSDMQQLTEDFDADAEPVWSPDHTKIAYVSQRGGSANIILIDSSGNSLASLSPSLADEGGPVWSADGKYLAFHTLRDGNLEIYTLALDGSLVRNLTQQPEADMYPFWSPDGRQIAFQSHRDGNWEIYVMDSNGINVRRLTQHPADDILPSWSPDGAHLLFWTKRDGLWRLYMMEPDGSQLRAVTLYENPGSSPSRASWSPDGKTILLSLLRDGFLQLYKLRLDGSAPERITKTTSNDYNPCW